MSHSEFAFRTVQETLRLIQHTSRSVTSTLTIQPLHRLQNITYSPVDFSLLLLNFVFELREIMTPLAHITLNSFSFQRHA
jgi:hypothetical protein